MNYISNGMRRLRSRRETAKILNVAIGTLDVWRPQGKGPRFIMVESRVRYADEDIEAYLAANRRPSESTQP
jgi:predicted site-specific integrase-resolvase